jgi:hypothetical protein
MQDKKLIDPAARRIPDEWRRTYRMRPLDKLPEDVTRSFDRIFLLEREKDAINTALLKAQRRLGWANLKIWILMLVVSGEGAVIAWVVTRLWEQMTK